MGNLTARQALPSAAFKLQKRDPVRFITLGALLITWKTSHRNGISLPLHFMTLILIARPNDSKSTVLL